MIILVEGPDGSGKTTLCNKLIERNFKSIHLSKSNNVYKLYEDLIDTLKKESLNNDIVIDRAYISNLIYENNFQDGRYISLQHLKEMNDLIDCIVISLPSNRDKYLKRFDELKSSRSELYTDMTNIYDDFKNQKSFRFLLQDKKVVYYDIDKIDLNDIDNFIEGEILKC